MGSIPVQVAAPATMQGSPGIGVISTRTHRNTGKSSITSVTYNYDTPYYSHLDKGSHPEDKTDWTLVQRKTTTKTNQQFIFVGNLPTNASALDIWVAVNGNKHFSVIYTTYKRDKNNNKFAFLGLLPHLDLTKTLATVQSTKLFGRILGFARANRDTPSYAVGIFPGRMQMDDIMSHRGHTGIQSEVKHQNEAPVFPSSEVHNNSVEEQKDSWAKLFRSAGDNSQPEIACKQMYTKQPEISPNKSTSETRISIEVEHDTNQAWRCSLIGTTFQPESANNITEKLLCLGIQFISVKALSSFSFLLLFTDIDSFDNFDRNLVSTIFLETKYTDIQDTILSRNARLMILGLPMLAWNQKTLHNIATNWGTLVSCNPINTLVDDFRSPTILIDTKLPNKITGTITAKFGDILFNLTVSKVDLQIWNHPAAERSLCDSTIDTSELSADTEDNKTKH